MADVPGESDAGTEKHAGFPSGRKRVTIVSEYKFREKRDLFVGND